MRQYKEDIDRYFDYNCFAPSRYIYIGSINTIEENSESVESGTNYEMAEYLIKAISYLESVNKKPIIIFSNNLGGDWYHGMAMYDMIRASRCHITMISLGYACSMGSIILQAADTRIISPNCVFMIHDGSESISGHTRNVERWAEQIPVVRKKMYSIYRERMKVKNPKINISQIEKLCAFDTVYSAEKVVDIGLADWVLEDFNDLNYFATNSCGKKWKPNDKTGKHKLKGEDL
jgi:ATP-dependent Clp endopeptidase proteolytic subunit ClpP